MQFDSYKQTRCRRILWLQRGVSPGQPACADRSTWGVRKANAGLLAPENISKPINQCLFCCVDAAAFFRQTIHCLD